MLRLVRTTSQGLADDAAQAEAFVLTDGEIHSLAADGTRQREALWMGRQLEGQGHLIGITLHLPELRSRYVLELRAGDEKRRVSKRLFLERSKQAEDEGDLLLFGASKRDLLARCRDDVWQVGNTEVKELVICRPNFADARALAPLILPSAPRKRLSELAERVGAAL